MTSKNKSKSKSNVKKTGLQTHDGAMVAALLASFRAAASPIDARKALLASVAGSVAAGLVASPSPSIASASGMATAAVDIAEEILKQAGILPIEAATASAGVPSDGVAAAS